MPVKFARRCPALSEAAVYHFRTIGAVGVSGTCRGGSVREASRPTSSLICQKSVRRALALVPKTYRSRVPHKTMYSTHVRGDAGGGGYANDLACRSYIAINLASLQAGTEYAGFAITKREAA